MVEIENVYNEILKLINENKLTEEQKKTIKKNISVCNNKEYLKNYYKEYYKKKMEKIKGEGSIKKIKKTEDMKTYKKEYYLKRKEKIKNLNN